MEIFGKFHLFHEKNYRYANASYIVTRVLAFVCGLQVHARCNGMLHLKVSLIKADISKYLNGEELVLQTRQLAVDINREHGQVRQLSAERVKQRKVDLLSNPPGKLIQLYVWQHTGMFLVFICLNLFPLSG